MAYSVIATPNPPDGSRPSDAAIPEPIVASTPADAGADGDAGVEPHDTGNNKGISPIERQRHLLRSPVRSQNQTAPLLALNAHAVSEALLGPTVTLRNRVSSKGKRKRKGKKKQKDSKTDNKWQGDERQRLKIWVSALMQMRFHDQLAYSGLHVRVKNQKSIWAKCMILHFDD